MKSFTEHHHCLYSDFCVCFYFPAGPHDPAWGWKFPFSFPQRKSSGQHCWIHDGKVKNNTREQSMAWPKHRPSTILTIKSNASSIKTSQTPVVSWWPRLWGLHMENTPLKIWLVDCFFISSNDTLFHWTSSSFFCTLEEYEWAQVFFYLIKLTKKSSWQVRFNKSHVRFLHERLQLLIVVWNALQCGDSPLWFFKPSTGFPEYITQITHPSKSLSSGVPLHFCAHRGKINKQRMGRSSTKGIPGWYRDRMPPVLQVKFPHT